MPSLPATLPPSTPQSPSAGGIRFGGDGVFDAEAADVSPESSNPDKSPPRQSGENMSSAAADAVVDGGVIFDDAAIAVNAPPEATMSAGEDATVGTKGRLAGVATTPTPTPPPKLMGTPSLFDRR